MPDLKGASGGGIAKRRVFMFGAGRRATTTIFPALHCLRDWVELAGVCTRTTRQLSLYDGAFSLVTQQRVDDVDFASIDAILLAVPPRAVPAVLRTLADIETNHITLMVDTPVLEPRDLGATRYFERFSRVVASEDSIALPPFVLAKRLIADGAVGQPQRLSLFHSGYRHHALASVQYLIGRRHPRRIRVSRWNRSWGELRLTYPGGVRATVLEPRWYDSGRFLVVGSTGAIVDYPFDRRRAIEIGYVIRDGLYVGLTVNGDPAPASDLDLAFASNMPRVGLSDGSLRSMLKIRGMMELLMTAGETPEFRYDPFDAVYDSQCLRVAERLKLFVDVSLPGDTTVFGQALKLMAAAGRATSGP